jgi:hypothetical protein
MSYYTLPVNNSIVYAYLFKLTQKLIGRTHATS